MASAMTESFSPQIPVGRRIVTAAITIRDDDYVTLVGTHILKAASDLLAHSLIPTGSLDGVVLSDHDQWFLSVLQIMDGISLHQFAV